MNVLFLNNGRFAPAKSHTMYSDLMREFQRNGHNVYVASANEKRSEPVAEYYEDEGIHCVCVRIGNLTKCSLVEKAITMMTISKKYISGIKKYFSNVRFDVVLYPTPPITFLNAVEYVKKRDGSKTYLLLKDIFPQNAVDIGIMRRDGLKGIIYRYYRGQEKRLYKVSDFIGCMSQANVDYVIDHNPEVNPKIVEVCPNCLEIQDKSVGERAKKVIREKYGIPLDKKVFVYGGNLGKPQGIPFIIECLNKCSDLPDAFFLIVGEGTEYHLLHDYSEKKRPRNVKLMKRLPKEDYDSMVGACDVGLIFLDHRFTIPNYPSRLLAYMQAKLPVFACTDPNTDIGKTVVDGGFGWWCESNDANEFAKLTKEICGTDTAPMKEKEFEYLNDHFSTEKAYDIICSSLKRG